MTTMVLNTAMEPIRQRIGTARARCEARIRDTPALEAGPPASDPNAE
jgi:hypothetical protein